MGVLQAIVLGVIQGLTEFIPVSSSAHLSIMHRAFGWNTSNLLFDVTLHLGTLVALLMYFGREWLGMIRQAFFTRRTDGKTVLISAGAMRNEAFGLWPIFLASVPAAMAGALLEHKIEDVLGNPLITGILLIVMELLMYIADLTAGHARSIDKVTVRDWLIIGLAQALAIVPGVSRSGVIITAGLFCGLKREASARFSFLLGAPIIFGAAVYELRHITSLTGADIVPFIAGLISAALVGYVAIGYLIEYLKRRSTFMFFAYRVILGLTIIVLYAMGYLRG